MKIRYVNNRKIGIGKEKNVENRKGNAVIRAAALGVALAVAPGLIGCGTRENDVNKDKIEKVVKQDNKDNKKDKQTESEEESFSAEKYKENIEKECILEVEVKTGNEKKIVDAMVSPHGGTEDIKSPEIKEAAESLVKISENIRKAEEFSDCIDEKNENNFYDAIQFDELEQLRYLIDKVEGGANARYEHDDCCGGGFTTALEYACLNSTPKAAEFLIENGAEITDDAVNLVLTNNMTSLGDIAVYNIMMAHAPEKMAEGQKKIDAEKEFISAAWNGDTEKLKELADKVYDINARDANGENALSISCFIGNFEGVKFLVENGARIDSWAMSTAISASTHTIFEYLMKRCDKELLEGRSGGDLLIDAAIKGNHKMVKALLDTGADVNYVDSEGNTPLSVALQLGESTIYYEETIKLLKEAGAEN